MEKLSPKKFKELFDAVAYEKDFNLQGCGKVHGVFSKVDDSYIGSSTKDVKELFKVGITEQIQATSKGGKSAQIGYNPIKKKWYGWSHRAGYGFGIGHVVKKGSSTLSSGWIEGCKEYKQDMKKISKFPVGFKAKTLDDCKNLAILFANSVS